MQARHALFLSTLFLSATSFAAEAPLPAPAPMSPEAAQHHPTPEQMVRHMDRKADLNLTDAQKQQMQAALQDEHAQMEAVHMKSRERMAQILTPEQQARLDKSRDDMRQRRADRMERHAERMKARAEAIQSGVPAAVAPMAAPR